MAEGLSLALLGLGAGAFGVMVGTGGGVILVPMLLLLFDMEPEVVAGTSLSLVAVTSLSGLAAYRRRGLVDLRSGVIFGAAAIPGSVAAPFAVASVTGGAFRALFGALLLGLAVYMLWIAATGPRQKQIPSKGADVAVRSRYLRAGSGEVFDYRYNEALAAAFNVVLGFISAFFGTGGGFIRTPVLVSAFGFPVRVAVATSMFALALYASTGAAVHVILGHVEWYPTFVWVGLGILVGAQAGARLAVRVQISWILRALVLLLLVMGVRLLIEGLWG